MNPDQPLLEGVQVVPRLSLQQPAQKEQQLD